MELAVNIFVNPEHFESFVAVLDACNDKPRTEEIDYEPMLEMMAGVQYGLKPNGNWITVSVPRRDFGHLQSIAKVRNEKGEPAPPEENTQQSADAKRSNREKIQGIIPVFNQIYSIANRQSPGDMDWRDVVAKVKTIEQTIQIIE